MPKYETGTRISIQKVDRRPVRGVSRIKRNINLILSSIWLVVGCISFSYFLFQILRRASLNLGTNVMGGLGFFMLLLFILSKVYYDTSERFFSTKLFSVLKFLYVAAIIGVIVITTVILMSKGDGKFQKTDYLIVLGAKVDNDRLSWSLVYRLDKAIEYIKKYPDTTVILSGGKGDDEPVSEALAMEEYIREYGAIGESIKIIREDRSTNTYENLMYTAEIIRDLEDEAAAANGVRREDKTDENNENDADNSDSVGKIKVSIVTSDYHMLRTRMLAGRVGLEAAPVAADTPVVMYPSLMLREILAVVKSYFFDK